MPDFGLLQALISSKESSSLVLQLFDLMEVLKERLQGKLRARTAPVDRARKRKRVNGGELKSKSKTELYELAQSMEIRGRSSMSKTELKCTPHRLVRMFLSVC